MSEAVSRSKIEVQSSHFYIGHNIYIYIYIYILSIGIESTCAVTMLHSTDRKRSIDFSLVLK